MKERHYLSLINLLRSNDVPRMSRIFCPKIPIFLSVLSILKYNPGKVKNILYYVLVISVQ